MPKRAASLSFRAAFWGWDGHHRLTVAAFLGLVLALAAPLHSPAVRAVLGWDVFAAAALGMAWVAILLNDPYEARLTARLQDASRTFLFVAVVAAATASLFAVGLLLVSSKGLGAGALRLHVALSVAAIFLSWGLIHTLFTMRYAHFYYAGADDIDFGDPEAIEAHEAEGGISFPGKRRPGYLDFAYFAFVIGMTAQVSDVVVTSARVRRVVLVHGLLSFLFNTAILAIFVNIVAGLL